MSAQTLQGEFRLKTPTEKIAAFVIVLVLAAVLVVAGVLPVRAEVQWLGGLLGLGFLAMAGLALLNLERHEGFSVVIDQDGLQLPEAPFRSRRRMRIPWQDIGAISVNPSPPQAPQSIFFSHVDDVRATTSGAPLGFRWVVHASSLETGTIAEIAALAFQQKEAFERRGSLGRMNDEDSPKS